MAIKNIEGDQGAVIVRLKPGGARFYGKWRHPTDRSRQVEVPLGAAWIVKVGEEGGRPNGATIGQVRDAATGLMSPRWRDRAGSPPDGYLTIRAANRKLPYAYADWLAEVEREAEEVRAVENRGVTFAEASDSWLEERAAVAGWKATTLANMKRYLRRPGAAPALRGTQPRARLMSEFAEVDVADIDARSVRAFLRVLDNDQNLSARSVNAYRAILSQVMSHAVDQGWCDDNPVSALPKRREGDPAELVVYTKEQIEAIACEADNNTMAALIRTAAGSGLRKGELLELRWRDVGFDRRSIRVERSFAAGHGVTTTKGRRGRTVPLADGVAALLADLAKRKHFTKPNDLVFCNDAGEHLDPWTTRSRYAEARDAAIKATADKDEVGTMDTLTFHSLRHAFCSHLAAAGVDVIAIQRWAGHRDLKTTQRYMHFADRPDDADRLSRALTP